MQRSLGQRSTCAPARSPPTPRPPTRRAILRASFQAASHDVSGLQTCAGLSHAREGAAGRASSGSTVQLASLPRTSSETGERNGRRLWADDCILGPARSQRARRPSQVRLTFETSCIPVCSGSRTILAIASHPHGNMRNVDYGCRRDILVHQVRSYASSRIRISRPYGGARRLPADSRACAASKPRLEALETPAGRVPAMRYVVSLSGEGCGGSVAMQRDPRMAAVQAVTFISRRYTDDTPNFSPIPLFVRAFILCPVDTLPACMYTCCNKRLALGVLPTNGARSFPLRHLSTPSQTCFATLSADSLSFQFRCY